WPPRDRTPTSCREDRQFLFRAEAAQRLQGRRGVCGRRLAAGPGRDTSVPVPGHPKLGRAPCHRARRNRISDRARDRVCVRTNPGRNQANGRCRSCCGGKATKETRVDLCRRDWRRVFHWIVFRWTLLRPEYCQCGPIELSAKSIAVLPFDNLSDDKNAAYFAAGIQDE